MSNNYSITDTILSSYFQIRAKFHPYIRVTDRRYPLDVKLS